MGEQGMADELSQATVELKLKSSIQNLLDNPRVKAGINALRVIDTFRHGGDLFRLFPGYQLPDNVVAELNNALEKKTEFSVGDEQKLQLWRNASEVKDTLRGGWLFTASHDNVANDPFFGFRAGHHIANVLPKDELEELIRMRKAELYHASEEDTFRGFFARLSQQEKDIYLIQLDAGKSRKVFDAEIAKDPKNTLALIAKGLRQSGWISPNIKAREIACCL